MEAINNNINGANNDRAASNRSNGTYKRVSTSFIRLLAGIALFISAIPAQAITLTYTHTDAQGVSFVDLADARRAVERVGWLLDVATAGFSRLNNALVLKSYRDKRYALRPEQYEDIARYESEV